MIKQRVVTIAMSLALIGGAAVGLTRSASADTSGTITVGASISSVLSLTLSTNNVNFGDGLDFLGSPGNHSNTGRGACAISNGARYISQDISMTVQSSSAYDLSLRADPATFNPTTYTKFKDLARIGTGGFSDCASTDSALTLNYIFTYLVLPIPTDPAQHWYFAANQPGTAGTVFTQYYTLDAVIGGPTGTYSSGVIYDVVAHP